MAWRKFLFKDTRVVGSKHKPFTHYWTNEGNNFPDVKDIEDYLTQYYPEPHYKWIDVPELRLEKTSVGRFKIDISSLELKDNKTIFIKLIDDEAHDIPQYYYCEEIVGTSDENYEITSYQGHFVLDCWATFGCKMNHLMKSSDNMEQFLFMRKMCDRYIFTNLGFYIDYLLQPWLMQTGSYTYRLVKDPTEPSLSLKQWLYINSDELGEYISDEHSESWDKWYEAIWQPWINNNYPAAQIKLLEDISTGIETYQINHEETDTKDINKVQNVDLANLQFDDSLFNSKGKYRYFNLKLGNFTLPKGKFDEDIEPSNGAIKTENTIGQKVMEDGSLSTWYTAISGETLCMIPMPKGTDEQKWLFALNTTNNGMILGNGSVLGMVLNDIPPSVLALSLRTFSNEHDYQPIGDELSFRSIYNINTEEVYTSPTSLTSLYFDRVNNPVITDWKRHDFEKQTWVPHQDTWYRVIESPDFFGIYYADPNEVMPSTKMEVMIQPERGNEEFSDRWNWVIDPETGEQWSFHRIAQDEWHLDPTTWVYLRFESPDGLYVNNGRRKKNWKLLVARSEVIEIEGAWPPIAKEIDPTKWYLRDVDKPEDKVLYTGQEELNIPCIFNDFSNIPINIAVSPLYTNYNDNNAIIGGTNFFKKFYDILSDPSVSSYNTLDAEPLLYGPAFWQWIYYIDGLHKIILTPDMIDFNKFMGVKVDRYDEDGKPVYIKYLPEWKVKLNVNMTSNTGYKLDIDNIKSDIYPFTKSTTELISTDMIAFPSTTETYQNWFQSNFATQETSKNAKNIDNNWARVNLPFQIVGTLLGSTGEGASVGASIGGGYGAAIGAAVGATRGGIESGFMGIGLNNAIAQANERWENDWQGTLSNMYSAPTSLNPSGFTSGSLIYSPIVDAKQDAYELFRTFTITDIAKREVWDDISMNGYFFRSECPYRDYENRVNYNIVRCNFDQKYYYVSKYLRDKMMVNSMLFSQQNYIDWFSTKCKSGIRLFRIDFDLSNVDDMIKNNIEINYKAPNVWKRRNEN